jgi:predicted nucleic acid-binding protein
VIFLDTGFLFAHVSEKDKDHGRVNEVLEAHRGERLADFLVTMNHVVAETITLLSKRRRRDPLIRHDLAVKVGRQLHAGALAQVHHATVEEEREAFAYFERHRDKSYSIVDCLSFVVMENRGIREA